MTPPLPRRLFAGLLLAALAGLGGTAGGQESDRFVTLASSSELEGAGFFDYLAPIFEAQTDIGLRVVAVGDGHALEMARSGDVDVLLAHDRANEEALVAEGHGVRRYDVMFNDYVIVGPDDDPAGIRGLRAPGEALGRIAAAEAPFLSRGDESGTHHKELELWRAAGLEPAAGAAAWYREAGSDMGATLNTANQLGAYTLADRASWMAYGAKAGLDLLVEGDVAFFNQYGITRVNPARHPSVKVVEGETFLVWMTSEPGQKAIADFRIDGRRVLFPNALPGG